MHIPRVYALKFVPSTGTPPSHPEIVLAVEPQYWDIFLAKLQHTLPEFGGTFALEVGVTKSPPFATGECGEFGYKECCTYAMDGGKHCIHFILAQSTLRWIVRTLHVTLFALNICIDRFDSNSLGDAQLYSLSISTGGDSNEYNFEGLIFPDLKESLRKQALHNTHIATKMTRISELELKSEIIVAMNDAWSAIEVKKQTHFSFEMGGQGFFRIELNKASVSSVDSEYTPNSLFNSCGVACPSKQLALIAGFIIMVKRVHEEQIV